MRWLVAAALTACMTLQANAEPIDILVLYTDKALANNRKIVQDIQLIETLQNRIFANSGVKLAVQLQARELKGVSEDKEVSTALKDCKKQHQQECLLEHIVRNRGRLGLEVLRREAKADLVSVWVHRDGWYTKDGSAATVLYRKDFDDLRYCRSDADVVAILNAYSVIVAEKAWLWWHFAHEIGHNLGLGHHRDEIKDVGAYISHDSFGYVDRSYPFRTIMAGAKPCDEAGFSNCPRVPVYSTVDPAITFFGHPVGDAKINAAATLRQTGSFVARYSDIVFGAGLPRDMCIDLDD